jgi:hypothetical protein
MLNQGKPAQLIGGCPTSRRFCQKWEKLVLLGIVLFAVPAFSQSCALCYTQAAASGAKFIHSLRDGILVLMVPPMFMSVGITWLAYSKRNQFRSGEFDDIESDDDNLEK